MIKRILALILFLTTFFNLASAAEIPTISVIGFTSRVTFTNLNNEVVDTFRIADDYLAEELMNSGKFDVYDFSGEVLKGRLDEIALQLTLGKDKSCLKHFNTEYIVYGCLTNLSIKTSETGVITLTGIVYDGKSQTACADLSANVVDTVTGKTVCTVTGKGESTSIKAVGQYGIHMLKVGKDNVTEECVHNALAKAVHELAEKIIKAA